MVSSARVSGVGEALRQGQLTVRQLVEQSLKRIADADGQIYAWAVVDANGALQEAERLDEQAQRGQWRSPLHGIPIGIKDIIDVFDLPTGCGSQLWANSYARQDAPVVRQFRRAGAVILGKTVTTPFAYLDPPPTCNPWQTERTPGGSSSGSAAAVAAGMVPLALGSQTGGSVIRPAAYCGIWALKPTYGQLSTRGILPLAPSLDHVGLMAAHGEDLQLLWTALRPAPTGIPALLESPGRLLLTLPEYLQDPRVEPVMHQAFGHWQQQLEQAGWPWLETPLPIPLAEIRRHHAVILAVEAAAFHQRRWRRHPEDYPPKITQLIRDGMNHAAWSYHEARQHLRQARREIDAWLLRSGGWLALPATPGPPPPRDTTGDPAFQSPWSYLGLPVVTFPIAWTSDGLPLAVQLIGPRWQEEALLSVAQQLSQAAPCSPRRVP
jgi:Asp-tRNA(Asn)/Glu-tRNA(Gln) amidotransferase A subunit family amidase